jgi:two-component system, LytTR family, sensor kinase
VHFGLPLMPMKSKDMDANSLDPVGAELAQAVLNDAVKAAILLDQLGEQLTVQSPAALRTNYHICAAFWANQHYDYEGALHHLQQAESILGKRTDAAYLAEIWLDRIAVNLNCSNWKTAQTAFEKAQKLIKNSDQPRLFAYLTALEGQIHLRLNNASHALEYLLEAERMLMQLGHQATLKDWYILTQVLGGLATLYERRNEREKTLEASQRILPIVEEHRLWPRLAWHYLNTGRILLAQDNYTEARLFFEKALTVSVASDTEVQSGAHINLGIVALLLRQFEQANQHFEAGAELFSQPAQPSDFDNLAKAMWWQAELYRETNEEDTALTTLHQAFEVCQQGRDLFFQRRVALSLSQHYEQKQQFAEALEWQKRASECTEAYYVQMRASDRAELDARYDLERTRQDAQMARLRVAGLQSRALRAQMNPHFLFNALNAIQGFITSGRDMDAATYLARFAKFMRQTLEYSDLEEVRLDEEISFMEKYLEINRKLRFRDQLNYVVIPPTSTETSELKIPAMIVQPYVENAIEHGLRPLQKGHLSVRFELHDDEKSLLCIVEDDGVGINKGREKQAQHKQEHQTHRSRGLDITRERLGLLHGSTSGNFVKINDLSDLTQGQQTGTRVEILLPLLDE